MSNPFTNSELGLIAMRCGEQYLHFYSCEDHDNKDNEEYFREMEKDCKDTADMAIRNLTNDIWEDMDEATIEYVFSMEEDYEDGDTTHSVRIKVGVDD